MFADVGCTIPFVHVVQSPLCMIVITMWVAVGDVADVGCTIPFVQDSYAPGSSIFGKLCLSSFSLGGKHSELTLLHLCCGRAWGHPTRQQRRQHRVHPMLLAAVGHRAALTCLQRMHMPPLAWQVVLALVVVTPLTALGTHLALPTLLEVVTVLELGLGLVVRLVQAPVWIPHHRVTVSKGMVSMATWGATSDILICTAQLAHDAFLATYDEAM